MSDRAADGPSGVRAEYPIEQVRGIDEIFEGMEGLVTGMHQMLGGVRSIVRAYRVRNPAQRGKVVAISGEARERE
jgi:hypothetical protein